MRYAVTVESLADLAAGAIIGSFAPSTDRVVALRRLIVGGRGATTPGQVTAAVIFSGALGGTALYPTAISIGSDVGTATEVLGKAYTQSDTAPAYGSSPLYLLSFNSEGGSEKLEWGKNDFVYKGGEYVDAGFTLYTVNAVPSGFLYTVTFELESLQ